MNVPKRASRQRMLSSSETLVEFGKQTTMHQHRCSGETALPQLRCSVEFVGNKLAVIRIYQRIRIGISGFQLWSKDGSGPSSRTPFSAIELGKIQSLPTEKHTVKNFCIRRLAFIQRSTQNT